MAILEREIANIDLPKRRPLAWKEYIELAELGHFDGEHIELIDGEIMTMAPMGDIHRVIITAGYRKIDRLVGDDHFIMTQCTYKIAELTAPEPDFAVFPGIATDYADKPLPKAELIIEVAQSSLQYDRSIKSKLYARADIPEYWIVNLVDYRLEVYRGPTAEGYTQSFELSNDQEVSPLFLQGARWPVSVLLPKL